MAIKTEFGAVAAGSHAVLHSVTTMAAHLRQSQSAINICISRLRQGNSIYNTGREEFESLCADLYELVWKDPATERHGRQESLDAEI